MAWRKRRGAIKRLAGFAKAGKPNQKLFDETVALLGGRHREHTIFVLEGGEERILASTIQDEDERAILERAVNKEFKKRHSLDFNNMEGLRHGVRGLRALPIEFFGENVGIWIMEDYRAADVRTSKGEGVLVSGLSLFVGAYLLERKANSNLYLDPATGMPGWTSFLDQMDALEGRKVDACICAVRVLDGEPAGSILNVRNNAEKLKYLKAAMNRWGLGSVYRIGDGTLASIAFEDKVAAYDATTCLVNEIGARMDLKAVVIEERGDVFEDLEEGFNECERGGVVFYARSTGTNT